MIEPPVCVPIVQAASRAAVAQPEPPDEPLGLTSGLFGAHALRVVMTPSGVVGRPPASGPIWSLPRRTAPAAFRRATAVLSYSGTKSAKMNELAVVRMPSV